MDIADGNRSAAANVIRARNRDCLVRLGLVLAITLLLATFTPPENRLDSLGGFLSMGALVASMVAALAREPVFAPHLTRWDEAAVLLGLSTAISFLIKSGMLGHAVEHGQSHLTLPSGFAG